ncbi:MAG TPA: hydrogenase maturation protease [Thermoanaerobaculia bacterium]
MKRIGILGLGSVLMGDDAVGPYAVELLTARWTLPPEVSALDAGTPGPDLADYLMDLDAAIVVDTVRVPGESWLKGQPGRAGELRIFRREEVMALPTSPRMSPHDPDLRQALLTAELAGRAPEEVLVVGVVPGRVELGTGLTAAVRRALPAVEAVVVAELRRLGAEPVRRARAAAPRIWWEATGESDRREPVPGGLAEAWSGG